MKRNPDIQTGRCWCCYVVNPDPKGRARALREAEQTLSKLTTPGWKIWLSHNLHWHWKLMRGPLSLTREDNKYSTLFSFTHSGCGSTNFLTPVTWPDPNEAVRHQVNVVCEYLEQQQHEFAQFVRGLV